MSRVFFWNLRFKTFSRFSISEERFFFVGSFSYVSEVLTSFVSHARNAYGWAGKIL